MKWCLITIDYNWSIYTKP